MANNCLFTTILIVVSSSVNCERRAFLQRTNNFQEAIPHNWKHDQEELNRNMVKNAGQPWGKLRTGPRPAPLRPNPPNQWPLGIHQNVLTDKEDTQYRVQQLQNKLMPSQNNILPIRTLNQPHPKPDIEVKLHKREGAQLEKVVRKKRDVIINPMIRPELALQPHIQPAILQEKEVKNAQPSRNFHIYNPSIYYPGVIESLSNHSGHYDEKDTTEKRDKRQIMFVIKQRPLEFGKKPRTTPNPFIRETNIADYDIVKTEVDKPEIDVIETVDTDSYQLSPIQKVLSQITKMLLNLKSWLDTPKEDPLLQLRDKTRLKRSPKMSKLYKKQKLAKKRRKKKKQQKLTPRQIKHYRRIREHKEERRRILHKKLKEKRRLRHKKMGTGPYNKSIIDYYGVYFDSSSSQFNDSMYNSIYDTDAIDSNQLYEEHLKNYPDYSGENEGSESEDYTLDESSKEERNNSLVSYEDSSSSNLNDSLFNSIYDTEAVDSDKIYEEHKKNYPESEEDEESEEENSGDKRESGDISKGNDDEGKENKKTSTGTKNNDKNKGNSKFLKDIKNKQQFKNTNRKFVKKSTVIGKRFLNSNGNRQKVHFIEVDKNKAVNVHKPVSKVSLVKQFKNKTPETKLKTEQSKFNNNDLSSHAKLQQSRQSKTKDIPKYNLVDVILDNNPRHDDAHVTLNFQSNINGLIKTQQNAHNKYSPYENIIPINMKPESRRIPI